MIDFKNILGTAFLIVIIIAVSVMLVGPEYINKDKNVVLHYFFLSGCPHCADQEPIVRELEEENPDVEVLYYDCSIEAGVQKYIELALAVDLDASMIATPTIFLKNRVLVGWHSKEQIQDAIEDCRKFCEKEVS